MKAGPDAEVARGNGATTPLPIILETFSRFYSPKKRAILLMKFQNFIALTHETLINLILCPSGLQKMSIFFFLTM